MRAYKARGSVCVFRCIIVCGRLLGSAYIQYVSRIRLIRRTTIRAPPLSAWRVYIYARGGRTYIYTCDVCGRGKRARERFPGGFYYDGARGGVARQEQDASYVYIYTRKVYTYILGS